jgi:energy-converting hydrogenase Eha subunit E
MHRVLCLVPNVTMISGLSFCFLLCLFNMNSFVCLMVFNATFNNISVISWRSVLLVEETGGPGENHWPVASHWQTLSHNDVHLILLTDVRERMAKCTSEVCIPAVHVKGDGDRDRMVVGFTTTYMQSVPISSLMLWFGISILCLFNMNSFVCLMVFNATFNNISVISWRSVLLVEETGVPGESHRKSLTNFMTLWCIEYTLPERNSNSQR